MSLVAAERAGHVLVVRMCREDKRNAVNRELANELDAAFNLLEDDADLSGRRARRHGKVSRPEVTLPLTVTIRRSGAGSTG